jgi:biotin carboxylase/tryptophan 2,3-dioxygenase
MINEQKTRMEIDQFSLEDLMRIQWELGRAQVSAEFIETWSHRHSYALRTLEHSQPTTKIRRELELLRDVSYSLYAKRHDQVLTYYAYTDVHLIAWYLGDPHAPFADLKLRALNGFFILLEDLASFETRTISKQELYHQDKQSSQVVNDRLGEIAQARTEAITWAKEFFGHTYQPPKQPQRLKSLAEYALEQNRDSLLAHLTCFPQTQCHEEVTFLRTVHLGELCFFGLQLMARQAIELLRNAQWSEAVRCLNHAYGFGELLHRSFQILNTMPESGFVDFRDMTERASAIQSRNYQLFDIHLRGVDQRKVEIFRRIRHLADLEYFAHDRFLSLRSCLQEVLSTSLGTNPQIARVLEEAKRLDKKLMSWRGFHLGFVKKYLKDVPAGTGGTSGGPYLRKFIKDGLFEDTQPDFEAIQKQFPDQPDLTEEIRILCGDIVAPPEGLRRPPQGDPKTIRTRCPADRRKFLTETASHEASTERLQLLAGSKILLILAGYPGEPAREDYLQRAKALGVHISLLDVDLERCESLHTAGLITDYVLVQKLNDSTEILRQIGERYLEWSGVTTFTEFTVELVAFLAHAWGLPGHPVKAVQQCRDKAKTRETTLHAGLPTPRFARIRKRDDLTTAGRLVRFPAILKPVSGLTSIYVSQVADLLELTHRYDEIVAESELDHIPGGPPIEMIRSIWANGMDMILEEFLEGPEVDIDFVLVGKECVYSSVTDNEYRVIGVQCGANIPSRFPPNELEQLINLAVRSTLALGFQDGVFHVEVKQTSKGPALLEVNARLGGASQYQLNLATWGVDLVDMQLLSAVGIPVRPMLAKEPLRCFATRYLTAERSGTIRNADFFVALKSDPEVLVADAWVGEGERVLGPTPGPATWLGEVTVGGATLPEADKKLVQILESIKVSID